MKGRTASLRVPLPSRDLSARTALAKTLRAYGISLLGGVTHEHVLAVHRLAIAESSRATELAEILDRERRPANAKALTEPMREAQKRRRLAGGAPGALGGEFASLLFADIL